MPAGKPGYENPDWKTVLTLDPYRMRAKALDHGITLVMSHFACADTPDSSLNSEQIQVFRELRMMFRGVTASLANSAGIFLGASAHCDLVRPGIALYGANPTPGQGNPMTPVVELKGRITLTRNVPKGATIGYGAAWTATHLHEHMSGCFARRTSGMSAVMTGPRPDTASQLGGAP